VWDAPFAYKTANTLADLFPGDDSLFQAGFRSMDADHCVVDLDRQAKARAVR